MQSATFNKRFEQGVDKAVEKVVYVEKPVEKVKNKRQKKAHIFWQR